MSSYEPISANSMDWCFVLPVSMPKRKDSMQLYLREVDGLYKMVGYSLGKFHFSPKSHGMGGEDFGKVVLPKGKTIDQLVDGDTLQVYDQFGMSSIFDGAQYRSTSASELLPARRTLPSSLHKGSLGHGIGSSKHSFTHRHTRYHRYLHM